MPCDAYRDYRLLPDVLWFLMKMCLDKLPYFIRNDAINVPSRPHLRVSAKLKKKESIVPVHAVRHMGVVEV